MTPIVDAHHHLLDPARFSYPWLTRDLAPIDRRFGPDDLAVELAAFGIDRTIVVQTISSTRETRELLQTAAVTPFIGGVIGWVDLTGDDPTASLEALRACPGGDRLVGIRHQVHDEPDPEWLARPDVGRSLAAVDAASLTFDLLVRSRELPAALAVARERSGLRFVIDHLGKPPIDAEERRSWALRLRPFGDLENVWAKLSGLVTEADWMTWQDADIAPSVDAALEIFGPSRLVFGSDWPVCLLAASYGDAVAVVRRLTAGLSVQERSSIFGGAAQRAYGASIVAHRVG